MKTRIDIGLYSVHRLFGLAYKTFPAYSRYLFYYYYYIIIMSSLTASFSFVKKKAMAPEYGQYIHEIFV